MNRRAFLGSLALLAASGGRPRPASSTATRGAIVGLGTHSLEADALAELRSLGVRHTRHTLYGHKWAQEPEYRRLLAAGLGRARDAGIDMLVVVHQPVPGWTAADFGAFLGARAREFEGVVGAWQIGNEVPFSDHAAWHEAARRAIAGRARVVTMAAPNFGVGSLRADAYAAHLYGYPIPDAPSLPGPVWVTEVGLERKQIPEDHAAHHGGWENVQRIQLDEAVQRADRAGVERVYIYQARTFGEETHRLIRPDGSLTPAALWLRRRLS